jgi:diaminopimelate decarboxylase
VTISGVFLSVLSGNKFNGSAARHTVSHEPDPLERAVLHRCEIYRKSFPMTEIAFPAYALRNLPVSKWARDQRLTIDVRTGKEFAVAIAAGIHLARMTVHADRLSDRNCARPPILRLAAWWSVRCPRSTCWLRLSSTGRRAW